MEHKYRGKRKDNGEWVYGWYVETKEGSRILGLDLCDEDIYCGFNWEEVNTPDPASDCWEVIPETIGAFTGLSDKNGKKIYEGDRDKNGVTIEWNQDDCSFIGNHPAHCLFETEKWFEIFDNIHEEKQCPTKQE